MTDNRESVKNSNRVDSTDTRSIYDINQEVSWLARVPTQEGIKNARGVGSVDWQARPDDTSILEDPHGHIHKYYINRLTELHPESVSGGDYSGIGSGAENYIGPGGLGCVISGGLANRIANGTLGEDSGGRPTLTSIIYNSEPAYYYNIIGGGYYNIACNGNGITIGG